MGSSTVRRVISAQAKSGKSVFAIDEAVERKVKSDGQQVWQIWGSDGIPHLPDDATGTYADTLFAPPGGFRVQVCEFPAAGAEKPEPHGEWPAHGTPIARFGAGLHHTNSVDIMVVMEGEVGLQVDDGAEVTLRAGDVLIQNGATHVWKLRSVPCRICMIAQGATRDGE
jgi:mannose-6-phosphate isomerase-like protein (cupin superfamily)